MTEPAMRHALDTLDAMVKLRSERDNLQAECERLRVIVDLACAAYTSEGLAGNFPYDDFDELWAAVAAEVARD